jgi:hypothetical protein
MKRLHPRAGAVLGAAVLLATLACSPDEILDVEDPDIVDPASLNTASAALSLRSGVALRIAQATTGTAPAGVLQTGGNESLSLLGGLLADEYRSGDTFEQRNTIDQRAPIPQNSFLAPPLRAAQRTRQEARAAVELLREYSPQPAAYQAQMFASSAFAAVMLGETFCNGIPLLSRVEGSEVIGGDPLTVDSVFRVAVAEADSALANLGPATPAAADSTRLVTLYGNFARIVKARALVNLGRYAEAAALVPTTVVPTGYIYQATHSVNTTDNQNWSLNTSARRYSVPDREGVNGQPWVTGTIGTSTTVDPRVGARAGTGARAVSFDNETAFFEQRVYNDRAAPTTIASGIEARMIEAEAALAAGNTVTFLSKLNDARASRTTTPLLTPLTLPATTAGQVDLLFRERAFWMYGTGHRLGDLRRLIRQYSRGAETVFPTGAYHKGGGRYGTRVNLPIPFDETNNPAFTEKLQGKACLDDNA